MTKLCFGDGDVFVDLTLLYIMAVYSLSLSIIIFKIMTNKMLRRAQLDTTAEVEP